MWRSKKAKSFEWATRRLRRAFFFKNVSESGGGKINGGMGSTIVRSNWTAQRLFHFGVLDLWFVDNSPESPSEAMSVPHNEGTPPDTRARGQSPGARHLGEDEDAMAGLLQPRQQLVEEHHLGGRPLQPPARHKGCSGIQVSIGKNNAPNQIQNYPF